MLKEKLNAQLDSKPIPEPTDKVSKALKLSQLAESTLVLKKIGQYPSLADMQFFELQKYQKILTTQYQELTKAIGLYSAGIGIGSFVYLRRIFETICEEAHQECTLLNDWDEDKYVKSHFNEKLDLLDQFDKRIIPDGLNPIKTQLYGVLSKGVHEYSEEECQENFPYIRAAIEMILEQKLVELNKKKQTELLIKKIGQARN